MKKIRVEDAIGQALCHDITGVFPDGSKGAMFRRNYVIQPEDVPRLMDIGKNHVFIWEPDANEIHEDDAALAAAEAVCGDGISFDKVPSEGKIQMYS